MSKNFTRLATMDLTKAAAALGAAVAKHAKKKRKNPKNLARQVKKTRRATDITDMAPQVTREKLYKLPVASAIGYTRGPNSKITSLPFSTSVMYLWSASGAVTFTNLATAAGSSSQDLHPIAVATANGNKMFGLGISSVAQAFSRWRLKNLEVEFNSIQGTDVAGSIVLASTFESFISGTPTYTTVSSCSPSVTFPLWSPSTKLKVALDDTWCYVVTSASSAAEQRQDYPATLLVSGVGISGTGILGTLRMTGVIEFTGLFDEVDLASNSPAAVYHNATHEAFIKYAQIEPEDPLPRTLFPKPCPTTTNASSSSSSFSSHCTPACNKCVPEHFQLVEK